MKKETIEKVFRRYINIFDDVVNQTTGQHLDKEIIEELNSEVDLIFKEYEQMGTLAEFNSFTQKIQSIINKVLDKSNVINIELVKNEFRKNLNLFESNPFVYLEKEIDETINKIVPNANKEYYIPANPYLDIIASKGYHTAFNLDKVNERIAIIDKIYKEAEEKLSKRNELEYANLLGIALQEINDFPIQFCEETINKYFYDKWFDKLILFKNSMKNHIIMDAINIGLKPHTEEYENALDLIFKPKVSYPVDQLKYGNDIKKSFINNNLVSRTKIINDFLYTWETLIFKNNKLSNSNKNNLLKKYNIIKNNLNDFTDASIIRFYHFMHNFNGGGSAKLSVEFTTFLSDESFLSMIINLVDMELTLLINELETVKFDKINGFILNNKKYSNIINDYYKFYVDESPKIKLKEDYLSFGIADAKAPTKTDDDIVNTQMRKINILYSLIEKFDNHYNYKLENIKMNIKNIIQKLKF